MHNFKALFFDACAHWLLLYLDKSMKSVVDKYFGQIIEEANAKFYLNFFQNLRHKMLNCVELKYLLLKIGNLRRIFEHLTQEFITLTEYDTPLWYEFEYEAVNL